MGTLTHFQCIIVHFTAKLSHGTRVSAFSRFWWFCIQSHKWYSPRHLQSSWICHPPLPLNSARQCPTIIRLSTTLRQDYFEPIEDLSIGLIKQLCTDAVFRKAIIFTVQTSKLISTNVERSKNCIEGEFRSGMIYEQSIRWGTSDVQVPFSLSTIIVFCSCKYFNKETVQHGFCCKHIIGQLRRVLHMTW